VVVVGAGSVGGLVASKFLDAGLEFTLLTGNDEITKAIGRNGVALGPECSAGQRPANVVTHPSDLSVGASFSLAILLTKANAVARAASELLPYLAPEATLVTLQNGYVEDIVGSVVGPRRLVDGVIGFTATMLRPGVYEHTSSGSFHLGVAGGGDPARLPRAADVLSLAAPVSRTKNIAGVRWSKLCLNCSITAFSAVSGLPLAETLSRIPWRRAFFETLREVADLATTRGVQLEQLAVDTALFALPRGPHWLDAPATLALQRELVDHYGRGKPSMLHSLERGRPTEVDFINGYVARTARELGLAAPLNEALTQMIHEIEKGQRRIRPDNVDELVQQLPAEHA